MSIGTHDASLATIRPSWSLSLRYFVGRNSLFVFGVGVFAAVVFCALFAAQIAPYDPNAINFTGHQLNFEDVVKAISNNQPPRIDGHEARKAVALICAIYESARNDGKKVMLLVCLCHLGDQ